ncbi:MAG: glutaminase A [Dermatophilaceae bacterium]|nr:glutaminase A [Intrasporangiaceae bacterium]
MSTDLHDQPYVSTGHLPPHGAVADLVRNAYERFRGDDDGEVSTVYPALEQADPSAYGLCLVTAQGRQYAAGEADVEFTMMSVAKPFVFAVVTEAIGADEARARIGVNATGLPFNSAAAVERSSDGRTNPMVNPGAIITTSLLPGGGEEKWDALLDGLSAFAGRRLSLDEEVYASATESNHTNQWLTRLLHQRGLLGCDPELALDLYTRQSCLRVTAGDLAVMGATLADAGVNPVTRDRVVGPISCHHTLAVMLTAGLYEASGDWLYDVGQPGKSGISGGIVTVSPGKGGLGVYSPLLDPAGNSVRGQQAARLLAARLGLDLLQAAPPGEASPSR